MYTDSKELQHEVVIYRNTLKERFEWQTVHLCLPKAVPLQELLYFSLQQCLGQGALLQKKGQYDANEKADSHKSTGTGLFFLLYHLRVASSVMGEEKSLSKSLSTEKLEVFKLLIKSCSHAELLFGKEIRSHKVSQLPWFLSLSVHGRSLGP